MSQQPPDGKARPAAPGIGASASVQGFTPLPTGARIGELVVQSVLGAGEFGITYLTEHQKRSKRYVLKEYFPRAICARDGARVRPRNQQLVEVYTWGLKRFLAEARGLEKLRHPALVEVFGVTEHGGTGYAGMAYEQGRDFDIWLHELKRIAPQEDLDKVLGPLLDGLELAHASKVYHLDLVPDCIVIRENGTPVLVDFGVFRVGLRRRLPPGDIAALIYTAPELLATKGGPVGPWTDIYSLAGLLYLAVTGKPPLSAVERSRGREMEPALKLAKGRYRPALLAGIDAGLAMRPDERPQTVDDWRQQLIPMRRSGLGRLLPGFRRRSSRPARASAPPQKSPEKSPEALQVPTSMPTAEVSTASLSPVSTPRAAGGHVVGGLLRTAFGMIVGGGLGGLAAYPVATWLRPECNGADCVGNLIVPLAILGGAIGLWEGARSAGGSAASGASDQRSDYEI